MDVENAELCRIPRFKLEAIALKNGIEEFTIKFSEKRF